jgi:metallo-beta-lactamase class B
VLIDALYGPYTDQLLANIRALGFDPKDIKLVVMTHGHLDHAGGAVRLKSLLDSETRFDMTREGWREAAETAAQSAASPRAWTMIEPDLVLADGQVLTAGGVTIQAFETLRSPAPWRGSVPASAALSCRESPIESARAGR